MRLNANTVKAQIMAIGFLPQDGQTGIYRKIYSSHGGYTIFVDFDKEKFIYDANTNPSNFNITVSEKTTSNFSQAENLVVLECVDRLLEKGYAPSSIELEKVYPSGRGHSGRLDILVKTVEGTPFLMIECKTWGSEYEKEKLKMAKNGGQLFTYYCSARATRYLCLYTSRIEGSVEYRNSIVDVDEPWAGLSEVKDIYSHWNKNFRYNGIFERDAAPYDIKHKALTYGELEVLKEEDSGKIYHQIMEILRHNAISDKPNAFNKLLNLFVCKIIDEDKNPEDELDFQWREGDTDETLQLRLNDLYKDGMWRFLEIRVIDYAQDDVAQKLASLDSSTQQWIMEMYINTRLKKSPNFAFVEVQDERTFALNAKVVREIVELLQVYKFRYAQRHEFLGNFFELLLNTSMKQEAGQYFTPVPITRFILSALPLQKLVQDRVDVRSGEPLPTVIDYACGSGHFLTEYMSQMQNIIDSGAIDLRRASPAVRSQFQVWQGIIKFQWAANTVYGIDLDNRLVKTTKVSAFFNGDGEANIVWANGLDHFTKSETYRDKLCHAHGQDNGQFDILISNPPYSVDSFKSTIPFGKESFTLYDSLTDNSSEIECLFVERMKQLLKVGGLAAVILPSSILTNGGIHAKARAILLKYFRFKAVVELGSGTFMKTGTNTVILFLKRRNDFDHENIARQVDQFFASGRDAAVANLESAFSCFVSSVYEGLSLEDYLSIFSDTPTEAAKTHELYLDYIKAYGEDFVQKAIAAEKEKMLYFLLTHDQEVVLVKAGKGKEEKKFLGYEFSERRGHEGLHWLPGGTMLYDEADQLNPRKVGSYIYHAFLDEKVEIDPSMSKHVSYGCLCQFIEYGTSKFEKKVNLGKQVKTSSELPANSVISNAQSPIVQIRSIAKVQGGKRLSVGDDFSTEKTDFPYIRVSDFKNNSVTIASLKYITHTQHERLKKYTISKSDVYISIAGTLGLTGIIPDELDGANLTENAAKLTPDTAKIVQRFLMYMLRGSFVQQQIKDATVGLGTPKLSLDRIKKLQIPLPPLDVQQKIVDEIEQVEATVTQVEHDLSICQGSIENLISKVTAPQEKLLGQVVICNPSKSAISNMPDTMSVSFIEMAAVSNDGHIVGAVDRLLGDIRKGSYTYFQENDIIIAKITPCMENGKCALATGLTNGIGMGSSEFHVFRCSELILPGYLFAFLNRASIREAAEAVMTGASGHRRVPIGFYQQLSIPLPSIREQQRIVSTIQQAEDRIAQLSTQLESLKAEKEAILKKYL